MNATIQTETLTDGSVVYNVVINGEQVANPASLQEAKSVCDRLNSHHAPAPWYWSRDEEDDGLYYVTERSNNVAVCREQDGSCKANAKLIAAAPELLEELKCVLQHYEETSKNLATVTGIKRCFNEFEHVIRARDAIAKATL